MHTTIARAVPLILAALLGACASTPEQAFSGAGAAPSADPQYTQACLTQAIPVIQRQAANLGFLKSAADEYLLLRAQRPADRLICSFQQINGGVLVQNYEYAVHLSDAGEVMFSAGRYAPGAARLSPVPGVSEIDILEKAHADAVAGLQTEEPFVAPPRLLFMPATATEFRLVFEVIASKPGTQQVLRITYNAENGQKLGQYRLGTGS